MVIVVAELNEIEVYRSIYTDEHLFNAIGIEGCVTIDIALAREELKPWWNRTIVS